MTAINQPQPLTREVARELACQWRADPALRVVSVVSPDRNREYALSQLWYNAVSRLDIALPVLWWDDEAREGGYVTWKT